MNHDLLPSEQPTPDLDIRAALSLRPPRTLEEHKSQIIAAMTDYMTPDPELAAYAPGYEQEDIQSCSALLESYITHVRQPALHGSKDKILNAIKALVLALNKLNAECGDTLIETMEREAICELIHVGAREAGLPADGGEQADLTLPWREW